MKLAIEILREMPADAFEAIACELGERHPDFEPRVSDADALMVFSVWTSREIRKLRERVLLASVGL